MNPTAFDIFALSLLLVLAVALPLLGIWDFRRLLRWAAAGRTDARLRTYLWILALEWSLTLGFLAWWLGAGRSLTSLGLVPMAEGWQWLAIAVGLGGVAFMIWQMAAVMGSPEKLAQVRGEAGELGHLAPRTASEGRVFNLVAVTAGICEEVLYRGFLLTSLAPLVGTGPAVALTSVIFGLGHAYQGFAGIGKTTLVGLVMALLTIFTGSLFIPMLLHAVIDLTSGHMLRHAVGTPPEPEAA